MLAVAIGACALAIFVLTGLAGARPAPSVSSPRTAAAAPAASAASARSWASPQAHIPTWAFDDGCNGGAGASGALVRTWVTYAESDCGPNTVKAQGDCHAAAGPRCLVMQYLDTDWNFAVEAVALHRASDSGWWLHEPGAHRRTRIFSDSFGGGYLVNQTNPAVRSFFRSYARRHYNADAGLLLDWQSPSLSQELYYSTCHCATTAEIRSNSELRLAHERMSAGLTHSDGRPFIQADNTLPPNPYLPQGFDMLNRSRGVDGWVVEGEPYDYGTLDPFYSTLLDQIAYVENRTTGFVVPMSRTAAGAADQPVGRRVQEATMLLGYSPGHLVDWANLETGSLDLAVWPEEAIYPTRPLESMARPGGAGCLAGTGTVCSRGGHTSLQVSPGVYRREFRACYESGVRFGPCAAIINTTSHPVVTGARWLRLRFHHEISLAGGDVQSGGRIALAGRPFAAGATQIPAHDAVLLAP